MFLGRSSIVLICIAGFAVATTFAQRPPLIVTGSIREVKVGGQFEIVPIDMDKPWQGIRRYRKETWFDVLVSLQYCNRGDETLIVPTIGTFGPGNKKILFLELPSSDSKVSSTVSSIDLWNGRDPMPSFLKELEKSQPSSYYFTAIDPDSCYESGDRITVRSGYKLDVRPSDDPRKLDLEFAAPEHPYFKILYSLSMKDPLPVSNAKRRWSRFGKLFTTSDGDFFLETEFIVNKQVD